jgi:hypothetical protein
MCHTFARKITKNMSVQFPLFRKYSNEKNFFKIISLNEFEEIQLIGKNALISKTKASIYPEKLKILQMIQLNDGISTQSNALEYEKIKSLVKIAD